MKVKCINPYGLPDDEYLTLGKIYEVEKGVIMNNHYLIKEDSGCKLYYETNRFEVVEMSLEDQLKEAEQKVKDLKEQIEANKIKIGQKYRHHCGDVYLLVKIDARFCLVCIEGNHLGYSYANPCDKIERVFSSFKHKFILIK